MRTSKEKGLGAMVSGNDEKQKTQCELLKDLPLFGEGEDFVRDEDFFDHESYADTLLKTITGNEPPLSIGLFGDWGIGKSTVINILFKKLQASKGEKYLPVLFNAWKYQGDSFRRQFLLAAADKVYSGRSDRDKKIQQLRRLNYTSITKESEQSLFTTIKKALRTNDAPESERQPTLKVRLKAAGVTRLVLGILLLALYGALNYIGVHQDEPALYVVSTLGLIAGLIVFILPTRLSDIIVLKDENVFLPQLLFPEQFEGKFKEILDNDVEERTLVVAVDDVDRCEPKFIKDVFVSMKTFLGHKKCMFIVACDDESVLNAFREANERFGYEQLRKYFNVTLRISRPVAADLMDLASSVCSEIGMPERDAVVQLALLADFRDARKVKHFVNTFNLRYQLAKDRQERGYLPIDVDTNIRAFAKLLIIEEEFSRVFQHIRRRPRALLELEKAEGAMVLHALGLGNPGEANKEYEQESVELKRFEDFWNRTRDVSLQEVELMLCMKVSKPSASLPGSSELLPAIASDDVAKADEIVGNLTEESDKSCLTDLLVEKMTTLTDLFLTRTVRYSLRVYHRDSFLSVSQREKLRWSICDSLAVKETSENLLAYDADSVFGCCRDAGAYWVEQIARKFKTAVASMENPHLRLSQIINNLYADHQVDEGFTESINTKLDVWLGDESQSPVVLQVLSAVRKPRAPAGKEKVPQQVPSAAVLAKVADSTDSAPTEEAAERNDLRRGILFRNWDRSLVAPFSTRISEITSKNQSATTLTRSMKFALDSIIEMPAWLPQDSATAIANSLVAFRNSCQDWEGKIRATKASLTALVTVSDPNVKTSVKNGFLESSKDYAQKDLREMWKFLCRHEGNKEFQALKKLYVARQWQFVEAQVNSPNAVTQQRLSFCYHHRKSLVAEAIPSFLLRTITVTDNDPFEFWSRVIRKFAKRLGATFSLDVAAESLSKLSAKPTEEGRTRQLTLFVSQLPTIEQKDKVPLLDEYFNLFSNKDKITRDAASAVIGDVKEHVDETDFKVRLQSLARELSEKGPEDLSAFRGPLDATLGFPELLMDIHWRLLTSSVKRIILKKETKLMGLEICRKLESIPEDMQHDLIHLVKQTYETDADEQIKNECLATLDVLKTRDLTGKGKKDINEFLRRVASKKAK